VSTEAALTGDLTLIPPVDRLYDGPTSAEQFVALGEGFVQGILMPRGGLHGGEVFLDVGCGNGSVARALTTRLAGPGRYEGLDINRESIAWLQERYRNYPAFNFTHANIFNKWYNPSGTIAPAGYRLPYADATFSMALLKSVFTHMLPADVKHYLQELGRVIRPGGRAAITYFLLNDESRHFMSLDRDVMKMRVAWKKDPECLVANSEFPEQVTGHSESRIRAFTAAAGFTVSEIVYGNWCGRPSMLGLQDLMILIKT
jgi:ubiquinone/menaquinone biosynthesis C-methylase UbiE